MIKKVTFGFIGMMLVILMAFEAKAELVRLPAPRIVQKGQNCWAATATTILALYNRMPDERIMRNDDRYLGLCVAMNHNNQMDPYYRNVPQDCCVYWYGETYGPPGGENPPYCNHSGGPGTLLTIYGLSWTSYANPMSQNDLTTNVVNERRPVAMHWAPMPGVGGMAHYMTIVEWEA